MSEEHECPTQYDDDVPATEDRFGAHGQIARRIAHLVDHTPGGKTIGLAGTWGSGKSTIVHLLQQGYAGQEASRLVWTFDAWAHEGDPLRRTFLESLIATLADRNWLDASQWTRTLERLSKRRKVTERRSAPQLTPISVLVAVSILLVPIGTALFSNQIRAGLTLDPALTVDWLAIAGLTLTLAPLIALLGYSLWLLATSRLSPRGARGSVLDALTVFVQRADTESRTETLDSGDPTSLEFAQVFSEIMAAAMGAHPQRRLVLVVDNLDRVGAPQALAVWSTLQTFLQRGGLTDQWMRQMWCLLPFDGDAIQRLWQRDSATGNSAAESFLDKTFQLRFEVPPPRLASWKDYLLERLARALPAHEDSDEFFKIYRLYSIRRTTADWGAPTPRQLKLFVNQVASLHDQRRHEIPLPDLAYYVLLQNEREHVINGLLSGTLPSAAETGLVSDAIRNNLAALAYGASVEDSHELLLRQPILDALEAADSDRLAELARVSDKFWLVAELALEQGSQEWPQSEGGLVLHAAAALAGAGFLTSERARSAPLFTRLARAARDTQVWTPMDAKAVNGAIVLAQHDPTIGRAIYDGFTGARVVQAEAMTGVQARDLADDYVRLANALGITPPSPLVVRDPNSYLEMAIALASRDVDGATWTHFVPQNESAFGDIVASRMASPGWSDAVRVAATAGVSTWDPVMDKARAGLTGEQQLSSEERLELVRTVHALAGISGRVDASKLLDELTDPIAFAVDPKGPAERALKSALAAVGLPEHDGAKPDDPEALGVWLYTLLARQGTLLGVDLVRRDLDQPAERARAWLARALQALNDDVSRGLARAVIGLGNARTLFKAASEADSFRHWSADRMLMMRILERMADAGAPPRVFPPDLIIDDWDAAFPGWSRYALAKSMRSRHRDIADTLATAPFESRLATAYAGTLDAHTAGDEALLSLVALHLPNVAAEGWTTALASGDMGLPLLHAALARRGPPLTLSREVRDAIRTFVLDPPQNQWSDPAAAAAIMAIFDEKEREEIVDQVLDAFPLEARLRGNVPAGTVTWSNAAQLRAGFAGPALLDPARLRGQPLRFAAVAAYILENRDDRELNVLQHLVREAPELVRALDADQRSMLIGAVNGQRAKRTSEPGREALNVLSAMLEPELPLDKPGLLTT